jgi:hypothetical protein
VSFPTPQRCHSSTALSSIETVCLCCREQRSRVFQRICGACSQLFERHISLLEAANAAPPPPTEVPIAGTHHPVCRCPQCHRRNCKRLQDLLDQPVHGGATRHGARTLQAFIARTNNDPHFRTIGRAAERRWKPPWLPTLQYLAVDCPDGMNVLYPTAAWAERRDFHVFYKPGCRTLSILFRHRRARFEVCRTTQLYAEVKSPIYSTVVGIEAFPPNIGGAEWRDVRRVLVVALEKLRAIEWPQPFRNEGYLPLPTPIPNSAPAVLLGDDAPSPAAGNTLGSLHSVPTSEIANASADLKSSMQPELDTLFSFNPRRSLDAHCIILNLTYDREDQLQQMKADAAQHVAQRSLLGAFFDKPLMQVVDVNRNVDPDEPDSCQW